MISGSGTTSSLFVCFPTSFAPLILPFALCLVVANDHCGYGKTIAPLSSLSATLRSLAVLNLLTGSIAHVASITECRRVGRFASVAIIAGAKRQRKSALFFSIVAPPFLVVNRVYTQLVPSRSESNHSSGFCKLFFDDDNALGLLYDMALQMFPAFTGQTPGKLKIDCDGTLRVYCLHDDVLNKWNVYWQAKGDTCYIHGICGADSVCSSDLEGSARVFRDTE
ncbi:recognition of pollen [Spatholobus suberectus]|nr:recognition of pollen [Spatholobus suberectus]